MEIVYRESLETPIGFLRIAASVAGIRSISFGTKMIGDLTASDVTRETIAQLRAYFAGTLRAFSFPTDPIGTSFERDVWNALHRIPFGETRSYLDIANELKNPNAIRAVGRANGANSIALAVPCHRVIGSDGSLTGYAGELWRKRWLLDHEARLSGKILL